MKAVPLLPRSLLFGNPDRAQVRISPDGTRLAWIAPVEGVLEVWVAPADDVDAARPVTADRRRGIRAFAWTHAPGRLVYVQDEGGDEDWHVLAVDVDAGTTLDLTPFRGVQARIAALSPRRPWEIVLATNDRDARWHDLHVADLRTGARTLLLENDRFVNFALDDDFVVRAVNESLPDGPRRIHVRAPDGSWTPIAEVPFDDNLTTGLAGVSSDGSSVFLNDSRGRDTSALVETVLATGASQVIAEDPRCDVDSVLTDPRTGRPDAVSFRHLRVAWRGLTPGIQADLDALADVSAGEIGVTARTDDDRRWTVAHVVDDGPVRYRLYDRATRTARYLFSSRRDLEGVRLAKMRPLTIAARDGLVLPAYLSLPPDAHDRPERPLPMVLQVHGGPWARDQWGFHPVHQWLANRGYAVLSVNYRGSTGFGKAFIRAADGEWAGRMHDDLLDAVAWAVGEGIADPARIAISGGSYGGYAALVGLTMTPDVFACGVDIVGPSSLVTLIRSIPPYWIPIRDAFTRRCGSPDTPEGEADLLRRSPISHVERIRRPLLIAQGANDPRVKKAESDAIVAAMKAHGIPVTYVLFPDEGHGFARPENSLAFHAVMEQFLAQHLGGRQEPVGDAFRGSSIEIVEGAVAGGGGSGDIAAPAAPA